jgi:hypothetical protein
MAYTNKYMNRAIESPEFTQVPALWVPHSNVSSKAFVKVPWQAGNLNRRAIGDAIRYRGGDRRVGTRATGGVDYAAPFFVFAKRGKDGDYVRRVIDALVEDMGSVEVWQDYSVTEKCDMRCREARGDWCECSCTGLHHGEDHLGPLERIVGETTIVSTEYKRTMRLHTTQPSGA